MTAHHVTPIFLIVQRIPTIFFFIFKKDKCDQNGSPLQ